MSTPETVLAVNDLRVRFRTLDGVVEAVKGINLKVGAGETVAIVGESGSGKSQTMMAAMRLLASNGEATGSVDYRGRNLLTLSKSGLNEVRGRKITMIFQEPMTSLDPLYTIGNQLMEPIQRHRKLGAAAAREEALKLLKLVKIPDPERRMKSYPYEMSGGQRQRVMIAMALANDPDILIADEPTTALDVTIQAQILTLLAELQQKLGMAIVFITHDLGIVRRFADRVYVMRQGEVVEEGVTEAVFSKPHASLHENALVGRADRPQGAAGARTRRSFCRAGMSRSCSRSAAASLPAIRCFCAPWTASTSPCARARPSASSANPDPASRRSAVRFCACWLAKARSASRTAISPRPTRVTCVRCGANSSWSSRIRSVRCLRA